MKLYESLSKVPFLKKKYATKFLFVAFIGIHIPILAITYYLSFYHDELNPLTIFYVCLVFTLLATLLTLYVLNSLIRPLKKLIEVVTKYKRDRSIQKLEIDSEDEVGQLINHTIETMTSMELLLKQKQDLIYLFSHDLKNYAVNPEILAEEILSLNPSPEIKSYTELILQSAQKQKVFLESFIKLINEEEKLTRTTFRIKSIQASELITFLKPEYQNVADSKGVSLEFTGNDVSGSVRIDRDTLLMVVRNLIHNAIKFTPTGGKVTVKFRKQEHYFTISVSDTGLGFTAAQSKYLFEKFSSFGRLGTKGEPSTGIGLYISNEIIKKAGGEIEASSSGENKGSTFTISLKTYRRK